MSLRQVVSAFEPSLDGHVGPPRPVPRYAEPRQVGFRAGADLKEVVSVIGGCKRVQVVAATSAGKSTRLPSDIARTMGVLVVQVFPNAFFASDVQAYVASQGCDAVFVDRADVPYPQSGVACISAADVVAKWLEAGQVQMPECVVLHDESHESDAYTGLVKRLAPACDGVVSYVSLTATPSPSGFREVETPGQLCKFTFPPEMTSDRWDLYGDGPWAVGSIRGHTLIFEDSKERAMRLVEQYNQAGFLAYRFHSRMRREEFNTAMAFARGRGIGIVIVVADNTFRSCLTAPFSKIIDLARVSNVVVESGMPIRRVRQAYELEKYQAAGRGARLTGLVTEYHCPREDPINRICELEAVEVEALALMLRVLGYAVPKELSRAKMAAGPVPRDLYAALKGATPLALLNPNQMVSEQEFFTPAGRRSPFLKETVRFDSDPMDFRDSRISAETARKYGAAAVNVYDPPAPDAYRSGNRLEPDRRDSMTDRLEECADVIRSLALHEDAVEDIEVGRYYYAVGAATTQASSTVFPDGVDSVCKWLTADKTESAHLGLSPYNRGVAVSALVSRLNVRTCELRVLTKVIVAARERAAGKDLAAVANWARAVSGRMTHVVAELNVLARYLMRVASGYCTMAEMQPLLDEERRGFDHVLSGLDGLPAAQVGPSPEDYANVRQYVTGAIEAASVTTGNVGSGQMDEIPMPVVGRGMRASSHYVAPRGPLGFLTGQVPMRKSKLLRVDSAGRRAYIRSDNG